MRKKLFQDGLFRDLIKNRLQWRETLKKFASFLARERLKMRYTKNKLEKEILEVFFTEKTKHKNRYNILGRGLPGSPGALEYQMQTTFTLEERTLAGQAMTELENRGLIAPIYKDIISPGD